MIGDCRHVINCPYLANSIIRPSMRTSHAFNAHRLLAKLFKEASQTFSIIFPRKVSKYFKVLIVENNDFLCRVVNSKGDDVQGNGNGNRS